MSEIPGLKVVKAPSGWPRSIDIVGQRWTIDYASNLSELQGWLGVTQPPARRMVIDTGQSAESMKDTLLHEIIHACLAVFPVGLDDRANEAVCHTLAPALLHVLRNTGAWWQR